MRRTISQGQAIYEGVHGECFPVALANFFIMSGADNIARLVETTYGRNTTDDLCNANGVPNKNISQVTEFLTDGKYTAKIEIPPQNFDNNPFIKTFGSEELSFGLSFLDTMHIAYVKRTHNQKSCLHALLARPDTATEKIGGYHKNVVMLDYNIRSGSIPANQIYAGITPVKK